MKSESGSLRQRQAAHGIHLVTTDFDIYENVHHYFLGGRRLLYYDDDIRRSLSLSPRPRCLHTKERCHWLRIPVDRNHRHFTAKMSTLRCRLRVRVAVGMLRQHIFAHTTKVLLH